MSITITTEDGVFNIPEKENEGDIRYVLSNGGIYILPTASFKPVINYKSNAVFIPYYMITEIQGNIDNEEYMSLCEHIFGEHDDNNPPPIPPNIDITRDSRSFGTGMFGYSKYGMGIE
jgi:hypothetical protein